MARRLRHGPVAKREAPRDAVARSRVIPQLTFRTSSPVAEAVTAIGRTEDVRFSPDNRLLAIAGFGKRVLLFLRVAIEKSAAGPVVTATDFLRLTSPGIGRVHGIDFIDDRTLAVANRDGDVTILKLPPGELGGRDCETEAVARISKGQDCELDTPGSVAVRKDWWGKISLLVCNNYAHRVTRHVVDPRSGYKAKSNGILVQRDLDIPDGIAISHDRRWIAVSSHNTNDVKLFRSSMFLNRESEPAGRLAGSNYPHGLRFTADDRHVIVADAGSPVVHVYARGRDWRGTHEPIRSLAVIDEEAFARGRHNPQEGGPKGLDIDRSNTVVVVTCEEQPLAFFDLRSLTDGRGDPDSWVPIDAQPAHG